MDVLHFEDEMEGALWMIVRGDGLPCLGNHGATGMFGGSRKGGFFKKKQKLHRH